jgi:exportin-1
MIDKIPAILDAVFECTLNMINKDFMTYPEHRNGFFKLISAINDSAFAGECELKDTFFKVYCLTHIPCLPLALLKIPAPQFKLFLDSIVWGFKHTMRDVSDLGLTICLNLMTNFSKTEATIANAFFQSYFLSILQDIFFVLTNTFHKSGFKLQSLILAQIFQLVDSGAITAPLFNPATVPNPNITNQEFLREHVMNLLQMAFPHLQRYSMIYCFCHG